MRLHRDIDLLDVFKMLRQRVLLIGAIITISMAAAGTLIMRLPKQYTATATIVMNSRSNKIADLQSLISKPLLGVPAADTSVLRTEMETISSPAMVERVIEGTGLIQDPEFNPSLGRKSPGLLDMLNDIPLAERARAAMTRTVAAVRAWLPAPETIDSKVAVPNDTLYQTVARVQRALSVTTDGVSYVLTIQFKSHNPVLAAEVANAFANTYLREQEDVKLATTRKAAAWLGSRIQELEIDVRNSEREFLNFRAQHALSEENGSTLIDRQISQISSILTATSAERSKAEATVNELQPLAKNPGAIDSTEVVASSPLIQALRVDEARLQDRVAGISAHFLREHPNSQDEQAALQEIRGQIDSEIRKIVAGRTTDLEALKRNEAGLVARLADLQKQRGEMAGAELKLRELERVANANRALYVSYLEKYKEISPQEHSQEPDARLLAASSVPYIPSSPNRPMLLAAALLASTGLAVGVALLIGWTRNGLYQLEALEAFGPVHDFGFIPEVTRHANPMELLISDPVSMFPEAVQRVYAALQCLGAPAARVILVSSALSGEGKSVFAASLARSIALAGRKTLLLDCDLRRPSIARLFGAQADSPLSEFIASPDGLSTMVETDGASGLDYVAIRKERHRIPAVLSSHQLPIMLTEARTRYDYIVIDSPPLIPVSDALLLSKLSDMMLLVVRWEKTPRMVVGHVLRLLRENKITVTGVLLTRVNMRRHARYNYGGSAGFDAKYAGYYR